MSNKTGWCMTDDCDADGVRGGCPVKTGSNPPCDCPCHGGEAEPRGYLEERTRISRARALKEAAADAGQEEEDPPQAR